ncbi:MAG: hypothetical protein WC289_02385 [Patescibacteria group bacterium]|jgi:hypothetical protein
MGKTVFFGWVIIVMAILSFANGMQSAISASEKNRIAWCCGGIALAGMLVIVFHKTVYHMWVAAHPGLAD